METLEEISPFMLSRRWYSVLRGRIAMDMATRSRAERRAMNQHRVRIGR